MKTMNTWQTVKTKPISTTNMYQRQDTHTPQPADQTEVMTGTHVTDDVVV